MRESIGNRFYGCDECLISCPPGQSNKIKIIEALWSIIYSNKDADIYETNLMRRLAGLLYIDNKTMGDIKEKIKQNLE